MIPLEVSKLSKEYVTFCANAAGARRTTKAANRRNLSFMEGSKSRWVAKSPHFAGKSILPKC